jgi:hypothetical protein
VCVSAIVRNNILSINNIELFSVNSLWKDCGFSGWKGWIGANRIEGKGIPKCNHANPNGAEMPCKRLFWVRFKKKKSVV